MAKRQQYFIDDYSTDNWKSDRYNMESISRVGVSMMAGALDTLCPPERAWDQALRIPSFANYLLVDGKGHTGIPSTQEPYWSLILAELVEGYPE